MAVSSTAARNNMTVPIPLRKWWQRPSQATVAITQQGEISALRFEARVAAWTHFLAQQEGTKWAVYHSQGVEFLAILCALWQLQKTACIPGDNLPGTVVSLQHEVAGFIGEFDTPESIHLDQQKHLYRVPKWRKIAAEHIVIEVYTSGSTSQPKAIPKTLMQLEQELEFLESLMPEQQAAIVLGTVSHQHLYGLTFRLLRPFCYQQAFLSEVCDYPEQVIAAAQHAASFSYVSSPAHLSRMAAHHDWQSIAPACLEVVSSAAPLTRIQSQQVNAVLDAPVIEIYGSSETGAIAWRCQQNSQQDALWQALPGVGIEQHSVGVLSVNKAASTVYLADKVRFDDFGLFELQGRSDEIVKIEGKRLSLKQMAYQLCHSALVVQAEALLITRQRAETGMVVELSAAGQTLFIEQGRKALVKLLKNTLSDNFERVVLPRRWRFVAGMPYNAQGKLTRQNLQRLFDKGAFHHPELIGQQQDEQGLTLTAFLPKTLAYFEGHFEQQAVLPGIAQLNWAEFYGRQFFAIKGQFQQVEALKFQKLLLPEDIFSMHLDYHSTQQSLSFRCLRGEDVCSSGRLRFA